MVVKRCMQVLYMMPVIEYILLQIHKLIFQVLLGTQGTQIMLQHRQIQ